ncbi:MAG: rhodanese-like domain-containing protein [Nodosilinea sp.]
MNRLFGLFPKPAPMRPESRVYDLKERLDWGEPALTIIDVRDRADFNHSHVTGAISIPVLTLLDTAASSFERDRDLYIYSNTDNESIAVAEQLRQAGYTNVSILRGGVAAWKAAGFPVEAIILPVSQSN